MRGAGELWVMDGDVRVDVDLDGAPHQDLYGMDIAADPFVVSTSELGH